MFCSHVRTPKQRQMRLFHEHSRMVNKINFHPTEASVLISGSQDGTMTLIDSRLPDGEAAVKKMTVSKESVRDVQWNINSPFQLAAVSENGQVQLWDTRRLDAAEMSWSAHAVRDTKRLFFTICNLYYRLRGSMQSKCDPVWNSTQSISYEFVQCSTDASVVDGMHLNFCLMHKYDKGKKGRHCFASG